MHRSLFAAAVAVPALVAAQDGPSDSSTSTVVTTIVYSLIMAAVFFVAFLALRPRFDNIYQPRSYLSKPVSRNVPALDHTLFGWVREYLAQPDKEILRRNGLDAYMFISYLNMSLWIIVPIWIFSWIFLMPLYAANITSSSQGFNMFTIGYLINSSKRADQDRSAGILIVNYLFVAWILANVHWRMKEFIQLRQEFITSPSYRDTVQAKTMLVTGVPNEYLSETKLTQIYGQMPGGVEKVWVNRNLRDLPDLVEQRDKLVLKLEGAVTKLIKTAHKLVQKGKVDGAPADGAMSGDVAARYVPEKKRPTMRLGKVPCIGEKVDTINYCRAEIQRLNGEIAAQRERAMTDYEAYPPQSSAFILFREQLGAQLAARTEASHEPYRMADRYTEAHPKDVIWSNLNMNPYEKKIRTVLFWVVTWLTVVFWFVPVAVVSVFSQVDYLSSKVKFLSWIEKIPNVPLGIIKGVLPVAALAVLNMLLPIWLRFLAKQSGIPTRNGVELSLMVRFSIFQLLQNFLVLAVMQAAMNNVNDFANTLTPEPDISAFVAQISAAVPRANTFFLQWVFVAGVGAAPGLFLQIVPLIMYYVKMKLLGSTPRTVWNLKNGLGAPAWGQLFPATLLIMIIVFGYMLLAPIVNGFAAVAMCLLYLAYRYLFLYVYDCKPENETAGLFFPTAINFTFAGLYLGTLLVATMYLFNVGANTSYIAFGVLTVLLLVLIMAYHYFLVNSYGPLLQSVPLDLTMRYGQDAASAPHAAEQVSPLLPEKDAYYVNGPSAVQPMPPASHVLQMEDAHQVAVRARAEQDARLSAFYNPARTSKQLVLWYPDDANGIGRSQVALDQQAGYAATTEHAGLNEKGKVVEDAHVPPGQEV
ncbi:hypothetical protein MBRA1_003394 [Malassezia brasiliensis]|uniref:DUF221-domain-containing protein n=1 Tax=Malassezia brasiliensis TaxID=1821822 RepID=A0AAF0DWF8_9BASI|nr:hypothetical protein MBRA1_003394 [Malassezia brasiliensis]